jgi:hypothetical protein
VIHGKFFLDEKEISEFVLSKLGYQNDKINFILTGNNAENMPRRISVGGSIWQVKSPGADFRGFLGIFSMEMISEFDLIILLNANSLWCPNNYNDHVLRPVFIPNRHMGDFYMAKLIKNHSGLLSRI